MSRNYAVLAGICASLASLFGKFCSLPISQDYLLIKAAFFGLMLLCNAFLWTLFVKALQEVDSSLTATVTSAASNYVLSAIAGYVLFGETTTPIWWFGMFFIIVGLVLITNPTKEGKTS